MLPPPRAGEDVVLVRDSMAEYINQKFKTLLELNITNDKKWATWKLVNPSNYYFILSPGIEKLFQLQSDVLCDQDESFKNEDAFTTSYLPSDQSNVWIMLLPTTTFSVDSYGPSHVTFVIKKANEVTTERAMLQKFQETVPQEIATLTQDGEKFVLTKVHDDNKLIFLNAPFRKALTLNRAGMFHAEEQSHVHSVFTYDKRQQWTLTVVTVQNVMVFDDFLSTTIVLPPNSFQDENVALSFVNSKVNDNRITFACNSKKRVTLKITDPKLTLVMDNNLRDIFGFGKAAFSGSATYTADGVMSLTRCIQYLYVYSNVASNVRVGNTESPLLAIVPFSTDKDCSLLTEKVFKTPMYIRVKQNRISQIDIGIYDGAGELVPFVADAVTTLNLHFRQL